MLDTNEAIHHQSTRQFRQYKRYFTADKQYHQTTHQYMTHQQRLVPTQANPVVVRHVLEVHFNLGHALLKHFRLALPEIQALHLLLELFPPNLLERVGHFLLSYDACVCASKVQVNERKKCTSE